MPTALSLSDPHVLYSAAVQSVESDLAFARRVYRRRNNREPLRLREDFCGTASLACTWAGQDKAHAAWGVDVDPGALRWGDRHYRQPMGAAAARVHLVRGDVRRARTPPADLLLALNFSYCVFKERRTLGRYFRHARSSLAAGGILVLDIFGGTRAITATLEQKTIRGAHAPDGRPIKPYRYIWEHAHFDAVTHHVLCHIHFKLHNGRRLDKAFTYDWRLWTIPEIRELMTEAGFRTTRVYTHGWNRNGGSNGVFREVQRFDNQMGWLGYVVGER